MNDPVPYPHPIRVWPTLAGAMLAVAAGSLLSGGLCAHGLAANVHPLGFVLTHWLFAAGCLFAANQLWVGRDRREQVEMFVVCLGMALPAMPALWLGAMKAFAAFGGGW